MSHCDDDSLSILLAARTLLSLTPTTAHLITNGCVNPSQPNIVQSFAEVTQSSITSNTSECPVTERTVSTPKHQSLQTQFSDEHGRTHFVPFKHVASLNPSDLSPQCSPAPVDDQCEANCLEFSRLNTPELYLTHDTMREQQNVHCSEGLVSCASSADNASIATSHSEWSSHQDLSLLDQNLDTHPYGLYFTGSLSLATPHDEESLSPLHCFMRRHCVEAITATESDILTPRYGKSHGRNVEVGQVGIQCIYCKHVPFDKRQERSVCFPSALRNIYHSIETWQRRHSLVCQYIPAWVKKTMTDLMSRSKSGAGGRRQYWEESARLIGMVDTPSGIRIHLQAVVQPPLGLGAESLKSTLFSHIHPIARRGVVIGEDRPLVTCYLFMLLEQMEICYFSHQDRSGGRSKVKDCPIGYPGFQCKHCGGKAGFGRYFPISLQALTSANSDRNIFNHIMKCRRCPISIKEELDFYMKQDCTGKNRRGSRKKFFARIWERMHPYGSENAILRYKRSDTHNLVED